MKFSLYLLFSLSIVTYTTAGLIRKKRKNGGKVSVPVLVKPPLKLKPGEKEHPPPGWQHCIRSLKAYEKWRIINTSIGKKTTPIQFQCTWIIQAARYDGLKINKQIQIAVQKIELGALSESKQCQQQFIEIIDKGKSQGRYCDKHKPNDYFTIGGIVRIDIQAQGAYNKQSPVIVSYRSVPTSDPGFRKFTSIPKNSEYDRFHGSTNGIKKNYPGEFPHSSDEDGKDSSIIEENSYNGSPLPVGGIVSIAICCTLVFFAVIFVVVRRCFCGRDKTGNDDSESDEESLESGSSCRQPNNKPTVLPGVQEQPVRTNSSLKKPSLPPNEIIIASETVNFPRRSTSSSSLSKKKMEKVSEDTSTKAYKNNNSANNHNNNNSKPQPSEMVKDTTKSKKEKEASKANRGRSETKNAEDNKNILKRKTRTSSKKHKSRDKSQPKNSKNDRSSSKKKKRTSSEKSKHSKPDKKKRASSKSSTHKNSERKNRESSEKRNYKKNEKKKRSSSEKSKHKNVEKKKRSISEKRKRSKSRSKTHEQARDTEPARRALKGSNKKVPNNSKNNKKNKHTTKNNESKKCASNNEKTNTVRLKLRYKRISSSKTKAKHDKRRRSKEKKESEPIVVPTPATRYRKKSSKRSSNG